MKAVSTQKIFEEAGFSLLEIMITAALAVFLAVGVATIQSNQSKGDRLNAAQTSKSGLATLIRQELSRPETCLTSFVTQPASYTSQSEIAVRLGNTPSADVAQAGAQLPKWKVQVKSLNVRNFSQLPNNAANGNAIYAGDIYLSVNAMNINPGKSVSFNEVLVTHLLFEVNGGGLAGCYADGSFADPVQPLADACSLIVSPAGSPGVWDGTHCQVDDNTPGNICGSLGGTWNGSACKFPTQIFVQARGIPAGSPGGTPYGVSCPAGSSITGGACDYESGTPTQLGDFFQGNSYYCQWPVTATDNNYNIYATCAR